MIKNEYKILEVSKGKEEEFLRKKTIPFDFSKFTPKEIKDLVKKMRFIMKENNGIGLSANQIGLPYRFFVAQIPDENGHWKFYAVFNPKITKVFLKKDVMEEGCLSVPQKFGEVERYSRLVLEGEDMLGKKLKIKAWGLLARVFQHEVDHLDGILFLDKAKNLHTEENIAQ